MPFWFDLFIYSFCIWAFNVFITCEFVKIHFGLAKSSVCSQAWLCRRFQAVLVWTNLFVLCSVAVRLYHMNNKHSFLFIQGYLFPQKCTQLQTQWSKTNWQTSFSPADSFTQTFVRMKVGVMESWLFLTDLSWKWWEDACWPHVLRGARQKLCAGWRKQLERTKCSTQIQRSGMHHSPQGHKTWNHVQD